MAVNLSMIALFLAGFFQEGGGEPESAPVYQLAGLTWWGALFLVGLVILAVWLLIAWQAADFDRRMASQSAGGQGHRSDGLRE